MYFIAPIWITSCILTCYINYADSVYTNRWGVEIHGDAENAKRIAKEHGFVFINQVIPNHFQFEHPKVHKRSVSHSNHRHSSLSEHPEVRWLEQQVVRRRTKRDLLPLKRTPDHAPRHRARRADSAVNRSSDPVTSTNTGGGGGKSRRRRKRRERRAKRRAMQRIRITDPMWHSMWYLNDQNGSDMNVQEAWAMGFTGKGIVVSILDDGIEHTHPDLEINYDPLASTDINDSDSDPIPRYEYTNENRHGTRCAGEVAAEANNNKCGVGIAYRASIGGVRMLDGDVTDAVEAESLSLNPNHIDIYSASWGPDDDGKTVDGPAKMAKQAFITGITKGRNGKGSIFVWASGNGGKDFDNCNCDGYTGSIFTVSISSATQQGNVPWYSEACSSTLATTYSSGHGVEKKVITTDLSKKCTEKHTGTSASAPMAAGVIALTLEANPYLTWRDLQHVIVRTAKPRKLKSDDWVVNGVGRKVSHSFGYGLLDAGAMVVEAQNWTNVPKQSICSIPYKGIIWHIKKNSRLLVNITTNGCRGSYQTVNYLEHVQAIISLKTGYRGKVQLILISPMGTRSKLLDERQFDYSSEGLSNWPFMTTHSWGERAAGLWQLEVISSDFEVEFLSVTLTLFGTSSDPMAPGHTHRTTLLTTSHRGGTGSKTSGRNTNKGSAECPFGQYYSPVHEACKRYCPDYYYRVDIESNTDNPATTPSIGYPLFKCGNCIDNCLVCSGPSISQCHQCTSGYIESTTGCRSADSALSTKALSSDGGSRWPFVTIVILASFGLFLVVFASVYLCNQSKSDKGDFNKIPQHDGEQRKYKNYNADDIRTPCLYNTKPTTSYIKNMNLKDKERLITDSE